MVRESGGRPWPPGPRVANGELAGLPLQIAVVLGRYGLATRAQVANWYRYEHRAGYPLRGVGPKSAAVLAAWLGADGEEHADDAE